MVQISQQLNQFKWPQKDDVCWYNINEVIIKVGPPYPISNRALTLSTEDIENLQTL